MMEWYEWVVGLVCAGGFIMSPSLAFLLIHWAKNNDGKEHGGIL